MRRAISTVSRPSPGAEKNRTSPRARTRRRRGRREEEVRAHARGRRRVASPSTVAVWLLVAPLARVEAPDGVERRVVAGGDGHQDAGDTAVSASTNARSAGAGDRHVEQDHRHRAAAGRGRPPRRRAPRWPGAPRDRRPSPPRAAPRSAGPAPRRRAPGHRASSSAPGATRAEPQLAERRRERPRKAGEPRDRREVRQRPLAQRLEAHPRGDRLRAERRGRRHAEPRHLRGGKARGELREARAVQAEGRSSRRRDLAGPGRRPRRARRRRSGLPWRLESARGRRWRRRAARQPRTTGTSEAWPVPRSSARRRPRWILEEGSGEHDRVGKDHDSSCRS